MATPPTPPSLLLTHPHPTARPARPDGPCPPRSLTRSLQFLPVLVGGLLLGGCDTSGLLTGPELEPTSSFPSLVTASTETGWESGMTAPDIGGFDVNNEIIRLSDFAGSFLLLEVGAVWCAPSRFLAPILSSIEAAIRADGVDFESLVTLVQGVTPDRLTTQATVEAWLSTYYGGEYRSVLHVNGDAALAGQWLAPTITNGLTILPTLILIGPGGEILQKRLGADSEEGLLAWIRAGIADHLNPPPGFVTVETPPELLPISQSVEVSGVVSGASPITGQVTWGDGTVAPLTIDGDGRFTSDLHRFSAVGFYAPYLIIVDEEGRSATRALPLITVYDPDGGFVVAQGTVASPAERCFISQECFDESGTGSFRLMARYDRRTKGLTGSMHYEVGQLSFDSEVLEWMLVDADEQSARVSGTGRIPGFDPAAFGLEGYEVRFLARAVRGRPGQMHIRIWLQGPGSGEVLLIYDPGEPLPLLSGNVMVQTK
jgi:hypothetical protein